METSIRILIVDDHPIAREGLRQAIAADPRLEVVAEASGGRTALEQIRRVRPAIVVLDIDMPDLDGFAVARTIREQRLPVEIVFLTVHRDEAYFEEALRLGAKGYVLKDAATTDIVSGLRAVAAGEHFMSPALTSYLVKARGRTAPMPRTGVDVLTPTERRIVALLAEYKTSREIGAALDVSHRTVQTHRANICAKLGLEGNHALMKFALDHKTEL
jgi:DNA-binding NarL/FixJ family response regulator